MIGARNETTAPRPLRTVSLATAGVARAGVRLAAALLVLSLMCALSACRFGFEVLAASLTGAGDAGVDSDHPPDAAAEDGGDPDVHPLVDGGDASIAPDDASTAAPDGSLATDGSAGSLVDAQVPACDGTDPCSCGTFAGHAYRFCLGPLAFGDAQVDCEGHGMQLVRVDDASEDAWLVQSFDSTFAGLTFAFIGASDLAQEGAWRWLVSDEVFWNGDSGGSAVAGLYSHWDSNKPFGNTTRNCAGQLANGAWEDRSCTGLNAYVCESP